MREAILPATSFTAAPVEQLPGALSEALVQVSAPDWQRGHALLRAWGGLGQRLAPYLHKRPSQRSEFRLFQKRLGPSLRRTNPNDTRFSLHIDQDGGLQWSGLRANNGTIARDKCMVVLPIDGG